MMNPTTLQEAIVYFSNPDNCREYMVSRRWPNGVICPTCERTDARFLENQNKWQCKSVHPRRQFSIKTGTIFEDSPLGLDKWLLVVWMITNCKNGVSSYEIHRAIKVTQKTAWFMVHRVRLAMQTGTFTKLSGTVEADESFFGGNAKTMHATSRKRRGIKGGGGNQPHKVTVMGMIERGGDVRTQIIPNRRHDTLEAVLNTHIEKGSHLITDQFRSYDNLYNDYVRSVINHSVEYVNGNIHTNSIENFWSLVKRTIKGTYVSVDPFHLFRYLDEQSFRYNNREHNDGERFFKVAGQISGKRLTYAELTGKTDSARFESV